MHRACAGHGLVAASSESANTQMAKTNIGCTVKKERTVELGIHSIRRVAFLRFSRNERPRDVDLLLWGKTLLISAMCIPSWRCPRNSTVNLLASRTSCWYRSLPLSILSWNSSSCRINTCCATLFIRTSFHPITRLPLKTYQEPKSIIQEPPQKQKTGVKKAGG